MAIRYQDPLSSFRFLVKVSGDEGISAAFTRLSGISMQVQTVEGRSGNDDRGVLDFEPALTRFAPVTLSRGVVGDYDFMDWLLASSAGDLEGPTGENRKRDIDIIVVNAQGQPCVTWTLRNALPVGYEVSELDANRSEVLMESITFAVTGIKREAVEPEPVQVSSLVKRGDLSPSGLTKSTVNVKSRNVSSNVKRGNLTAKGLTAEPPNNLANLRNR